MLCCKYFAFATWQSSSSMIYVKSTSQITRFRPVAVDVSLPGSYGRVANFNKCISMEHTRSESANQTENGARHQEKDVCFYRDAKELEGISSRRWEQTRSVGVLVTWSCSPSTGIGLGTVYKRHTYYVEFSAPLVGHDSSQEEANTCLFLPAAIA